MHVRRCLCADSWTNILRSSGVARVQVSVAHFSRGRCRYLQRTGNFSRRRSCRDVTYLNAVGTTAWRFAKSLPRLPRGEYKVWIRGIDKAGNVERKDARRNFLRVFLR